MKRKKIHDMLFLMLDPRFKNLGLVSSFISCKQVVLIVEDYDKQCLFPMLLKSHHAFHPLLEFEIMAYQLILVLIFLRSSLGLLS
jgi:hypothetical protein